MILLPPRSTRTDTLFPDTTLCRCHVHDTASQSPAPSTSTQCTPGMAANASPGGGMGQVQQGMGGQNMMQMMQMMQQRSEEHTSELQSLMRNSYAVFCLKNKTNKMHNTSKQFT